MENKVQKHLSDIDRRVTALESIFISQGIILLARTIKRIIRESESKNA